MMMAIAITVAPFLKLLVAIITSAPVYLCQIKTSKGEKWKRGLEETSLYMRKRLQLIKNAGR